MKDHSSLAPGRAVATGRSDRVVAVHEDWTQLEAVWRGIEATGYCSVFQSYDWVAAWYRTALRFKFAKPLVVTVADAAGVVWILPLCYHRRMGMTFISFADLAVSDYAGPVMAREDRIAQDEVPAVLAAIRKALTRCDMIHFQKLPVMIEGRDNPLLQMGPTVAMRESCYGIKVHRPWADLSKDIMQSRLRSTIRQQKKKIAAHGPLSLHYSRTPEAMTRALEELMEMRKGRFERIGREYTPLQWRSFYQEVAGDPNRQMDVSITTLRVGSTPIAACFGLTRGQAYHVVMPTFAAAEWESFRPGMLMFDAMLEEFGPQTGFDGFFDFTIGDEPYKARFGATASPLMEYMSPKSLLGRLAHVYWRRKAARRGPSAAVDQSDLPPA
ncbi:MAG: GNAT family N-acetyltransferase [Rhodobacteraceae bacterium]|nr:GNAT family N-acetyltransferase [Paracoccaceae bacterium]